jgi:hypothetical protein
MELRADGLELHLRPAARANIEGWTKVEVEARVAGFVGRYTAWLQLEDLKRFEHSLREMQNGLGRESKAALASAEPDLFVELTMNRLGHITGHYIFESERRDGVPTTLSGAFDMDQSFLPSLKQEIAALVSQLCAEKSL